jgi:Zn-dependent protease
MPFRCPYCGNYFCAQHRLPENHNCPEIWKAKIAQPPLQTATPTQGTYQHTITTYAPVIPKKGLRFSPKEIQHILIGTALVMAVGISITLGTATGLALNATTAITIPIILAALFTASFLLHEMAHKTMAQRYGLWAEFRLTTWGALITLVSIISPLKLISPGAVMISGSFVDNKIMGKTAIAGPATNIILAATLGISSLIAPPNSAFSFILLYSAYINAFLATFNLIPFGIIDGYKIFTWNKLIWLLAFTIAISLTIPTAYYLFTNYLYY